jgi:hypothetical protein
MGTDSLVGSFIKPTLGKPRATENRLEGLGSKRSEAAGDAVLLLMDDLAGRLEAKTHGLALIGTAALSEVGKL